MERENYRYKFAIAGKDDFYIPASHITFSVDYIRNSAIINGIRFIEKTTSLSNTDNLSSVLTWIGNYQETAPEMSVFLVQDEKEYHINTFVVTDATLVGRNNTDVSTLNNYLFEKELELM